MSELGVGFGALVTQDDHRTGPERSNSDIAQQAVLPLLKDYSDQVNSRCEQYLKARTLATILACLNVLGSAASVAMSWVASLFTLPIRVGLTALFVAVSLFSLVTLLPRLRMLRHGVRSTARQLERVVRFASQFADHAVVDVGDRLALEVRIGEAEAALEQARVVLSSPLASLRSLDVSAGRIELTFEPEETASSKPTAGPGNLPRTGQRRVTAG